MKRILFFADASNLHTRRWVLECARRGFDCVVVTRRPADVPGASDVIAIRPGSDSWSWFAALPEVRRIARRLTPHWVHGHYVTSYGLWAAHAARPACARLALTAWGSDILVTPRAPGWRGLSMARLVGWSLRRADLITADARDVLDAIGHYRPRARLEEVLWGADTELFTPGTPAEGFEAVSLRSWEPNYNIDVLLRGWAALVRNRRSERTALHLLGGGPDASALHALANSLDIIDSVRFTGRVGEGRMIETLQRARVSISIPTSDATSVSLLESMACGLPVVVSDLPANRRWIEPSTRLVVPARSDVAVADALARLHDDAAFSQEQGQLNRMLVVAQASRDRQFDRMAKLYEQCGWAESTAVPDWKS